jgi:predicted helicase
LIFPVVSLRTTLVPYRACFDDGRNECLFGGFDDHAASPAFCAIPGNFRTQREKGNYFERLAVAFIKHDPGMAQEYEDPWLYTDWAKAHGVAANDIGVDAVAKIKGEDSFCAIQCKFYAEGRSIPKGELDKFLSACGMSGFHAASSSKQPAWTSLPTPPRFSMTSM